MNYRNLVELHRLQAERLGPRPALRFRSRGVWSDLSWEDYRERALACASALVDAGIEPGDRVGLLSENRVDWLVADMGLLTASAVNVPPHSPLSGPQVQFQLADAGVRWLFVSNAAQLEKMRPVLPDLPALIGIVVFDSVSADGEIPKAKTRIESWDSFLQTGRRSLPNNALDLAKREASLGPDDLATVIYTSGTTGNPKGVMLTHANLLGNVAGVLAAEVSLPDEVQLSWLPYSHIYARTMDHYRVLISENLLALSESADTVVRDLGEVQPMTMTAVPRFFEKLLAAVTPPHSTEAPPPGDLIARRLRGVFGPRIRLLCSGGAPLPVAVAEAYQASGLPLLQGYGLTESSPVITFNRSSSNRIGTVGLPLPDVNVRIDTDGEVLARGPNIMKGYWNNPTATAESLHDGWLYTGDLGALDADGYLSITGRKKELLVLSNGKKVVPTHIEGLLLGEPAIDQAVVHGEGRNFLTALIVPNWAKVCDALKLPVTAGSDPETLCKQSQVQQLLQERIDQALCDVASYERVKKFVILPKPFSVEAEELTVSLKLRRNVVLEKHKAVLEELYRG